MVIQSAWLSLLSELRITNGISECHRYLAPLVTGLIYINIIYQLKCLALAVEFKKNLILKFFLKMFFFCLCQHQGYPWVPSTNFSPFGPAIWPAVTANMSTHVLFYYIEEDILDLPVSFFVCVQNINCFFLYDCIGHLKPR